MILKIVLPKNFGLKIAVFPQNTASLCKQLIKNCFFRRKFGENPRK
jgi:hypothetical protein